MLVLFDALRRMSLREARADGRRRDVVVLRVELDSMMMMMMIVLLTCILVPMRCYDVMIQDIMRLLK